MDQIWSDTLQNLQQQMTAATFGSVLSNSRLVSANGTYVVQVGSDRAREWLENRLAGVVAGALGSVVGQAVDVEQLKFVNAAAEALPEIDTKLTNETPLRIRDSRNGHRYMIDRELIFNGYSEALGPHGIAVYNVLVAHAGNRDQSGNLYYSTIARQAGGISRRHAMRMVKLLEEHHLICVEHKADGKSSNDYVLTDVLEWKL